MKKDIEKLLKIQEKDIKIFSLKKEGNTLPEALQVEKEDVQEMEDKVNAKHEEVKKLQVAKKELEVDIETKQGNIKKFEIQLYQLKTNEEYKSMQKQITDLKFECGLVEDKILVKMEEIEKAQAEHKETENMLGLAKKNFSDREKEINKKVADIKVEIEYIQKERDLLIKDIPADFLKKYEIIFKNKHGAALVAVENKICRGCHMTLPPNVVNEVRKGTNIVICDNCARILYYAEQAA